MKKLFLVLLSFFSFGCLAQNYQWAGDIGSVQFENSGKICLDASGNVYTVGNFRGTADFDPGPGTFYLSPATSFSSSYIAPDAFISKLDANGNFVWAKQISGPSTEYGISMTFDASGNIYIIGYFNGTSDFDPGPGTFTMTAYGSAFDAFICKLDASGNFLWAKHMGGVGSNVIPYSITPDASGNIYLDGYFQGSIDFDPGITNYVLIAGGSSDFFVCKLDASGNFGWAKSLGANYAQAYSIALDVYGNIYTAGVFAGTVDFDPGPGVFNLTNAGSPGVTGDIFISKLDGSGNFLWAKRMGGIGGESFGSMVLDPLGNICTTGIFTLTADFDPGAGTYNLNATGGDIFISKLDGSGNFIWAKNIGGSGLDDVTAVTDVSGNIYMTGNFIGPADFDPGMASYTINSISSSYDVYICKLDPSGNFIWAESVGGTDNEIGNSITADYFGNVYITGLFYSINADFDPGQGISTLSSLGAGDVFIAKYGICLSPAVTINTTAVQLCEGNPVTLTAAGTGTITWFATPSSTIALATGTIFSTPVLGAGTYSYYAEAFTCATSARAQVLINVFALPLINLTAQPPVTCLAQAVTLSASGSSNTYSWVGLGSGSSFVVSPPNTISYTVTGVGINNCTNSAAITVTVVDCTGILGNEQNQISIILFPNPTSDIIKICVSNNLDISLYRVHDQTGRLILDGKINNIETIVDISSLANGLYFISIGEQNKQIKLIKE